MTVTNYITGASGFIGSRLLRALIKQSNGTTICIPNEQIQFTKLHPFKRLFFLSAYGNMAHHKDERMMLQANVADLMYLAQQAKAMEFESFIYMSSSSVMLPVQTEYSRTKRHGEDELSFILPNRHAVVRCFSVTGVGEQKEHLIPKLIASCFEGVEMPFVPDPCHDFVDVEDVVDGLIEIADNKRTGTFELGSGYSTANNDVRGLVAVKCGKFPNTKDVESLRDYDTEKWVSHPTNWPGNWFPKKSLLQSITQMVEDYVERTGKENYRHQLQAQA